MSALMVAMIACEQPGCDATFTIRADLDATRKAANEWDNGWRSFPSIHMDYCPEHQ